MYKKHTDHAALLEAMCTEAQVLVKGGKVFRAMELVPRHLFVTNDLLRDAYVDAPLPLPLLGFNLSAHHIYCMCLETLDIQPGQSFLDIGCGSGYVSAVASFITGPVI